MSVLGGGSSEDVRGRVDRMRGGEMAMKRWMVVLAVFGVIAAACTAGTEDRGARADRDGGGCVASAGPVSIWVPFAGAEYKRCRSCSTCSNRSTRGSRSTFAPASGRTTRRCLAAIRAGNPPTRSCPGRWTAWASSAHRGLAGPHAVHRTVGPRHEHLPRLGHPVHELRREPVRVAVPDRRAWGCTTTRTYSRSTGTPSHRRRCRSSPQVAKELTEFTPARFDQGGRVRPVVRATTSSHRWSCRSSSGRTTTTRTVPRRRLGPTPTGWPCSSGRGPLVGFYGADNLKEFFAWPDTASGAHPRTSRTVGSCDVRSASGAAIIEDYRPDVNYGPFPVPDPGRQEDGYVIGRVVGTIMGIPRGSEHPCGGVGTSCRTWRPTRTRSSRWRT